MGRGLAILIVFAVLIGASAYWAPFKLTATTRKTAAVVETAQHAANTQKRASDEAPSNAAATADSIAPLRKSASSDNVSPREPVLTATSPSANTPLATLPPRAIPGFPAKPVRDLHNDDLASLLKQAKHLCAEGHLSDARNLLSEAYLTHRLTREQRLRLAEYLEPLVDEILRSRSNLENGQLYEVEHGDVLVKIARPFQVPHEFVMRINGLRNARAIRPRQELKLVQGPFDALAETADLELTVLHHGKFVRRFAIGVGRTETPTPLGLFKVTTKLVNPTYYPPPSDTEHRRPIPPGHPDNPLGSRWIDIGLGYGIHGTNDPQSVGLESSRGCIRMQNEDVEQLYDMLSEASRVLVR